VRSRPDKAQELREGTHVEDSAVRVVGIDEHDQGSACRDLELGEVEGKVTFRLSRHVSVNRRAISGKSG
jgi:hypothetical protein